MDETHGNPQSRTAREKVFIRGGWVKSVAWTDGMKAKSVVLTRDESKAATFLPSYAASLREQFSPEAEERGRAAERRLRAEIMQIVERLQRDSRT